MVARVAVVYGTRPEAIKLAPVVLSLRGHAALEPVVLVTAQHREMLDQVNDLFGIRPDIDLNVIKPRQSLGELTAAALALLLPALREAAPSIVLVQGDTTTTFVGALAAYYLQLPVAHLEAGLRTNNRYSPFPEELNRRLTTQLADLHLAPTPTSRRNLLKEGITPESVVVTGNTVIDALVETVGKDVPFSDRHLAGLGENGRPLVLVTAHRRESWGEPLSQVARAVRTLALTRPNVDFVIPMHRNPVVRESLVPTLHDVENVVLTEPLPYGEFARVMNASTLVVTDSGGVQEEAPSLGKPVLVTRDTTERPEAVEFGTAKLVGTHADAIVEAVVRLFDDKQEFARMANAVNPYGDGHASHRVVAALSAVLSIGRRLPDFSPETSAA